MRIPTLFAGAVVLTASLFLPTRSSAQRKGAPTPDGIGSDSLFARVAGLDRKVNAEEFSAFMKERPAVSRAGELPTFVDSIFKRLDTDKTGWLSRPEFATVATMVAFVDAQPAGARGRGAGRPGRGAPALAAAAAARKAAKGDSAVATPVADSLFVVTAGSDGKVSREEFTTFMKDRPAGARIGQAGGNTDRIFGRMDTDADGFLSRVEFTALAKALGGRGRGRGLIADTTSARRPLSFRA